MLLISFFTLVFYSLLIVFISKYIMMRTIRKLAIRLQIKSKTIGDIMGVSTSIPELLTITTSSLRGLIGASIYNVLSSNIINLVQYVFTIFFSHNIKRLKNKAILFDLFLALITILLPMLMLKQRKALSLTIVPLFLGMFIFFIIANNQITHYYVKNDDKKNNNNKKKKYNSTKELSQIVKQIIILLSASIILFFLGELLGNTLEKLCNHFKIKQEYIGILLGFITSIPELISFFEAQRFHKKEESDILGVVEATNSLLISNMINLFIIQTISALIITAYG